MALLYAHLGSSTHAELEQISRAMLAHPKLVAGEGRFDTELMSRSHEQVIEQRWRRGHSVPQSEREMAWVWRSRWKMALAVPNRL